MRKRAGAALVAVGILSATSVAHSLFLRPASFFLPPNAPAAIPLLNGTFGLSENAIERDRMLDVNLVGPEKQVTHPATEQWRDQDEQAVLDLTTGEPGTYTLGVSTAPRVIELPAPEFNDYLRHDGVTDTLEAREEQGRLENPARERYSKHVKALLQVGDARTEGFQARLDYPIEIVAQQNPYDLTIGGTLDVQVFRDGQPLPGQLVYASYGTYHEHDETGSHVEACQDRTDDQGMASIELSAPGQWYVRMIHMQEVDEPDVDYESNWATLTFEVPEPAATWPNQILLALGSTLVVILLLLVWRHRAPPRRA